MKAFRPGIFIETIAMISCLSGLLYIQMWFMKWADSNLQAVRFGDGRELTLSRVCSKNRFYHRGARR